MLHMPASAEQRHAGLSMQPEGGVLDAQRRAVERVFPRWLHGEGLLQDMQ